MDAGLIEMDLMETEDWRHFSCDSGCTCAQFLASVLQSKLTDNGIILRRKKARDVDKAKGLFLASLSGALRYNRGRGSYSSQLFNLPAGHYYDIAVDFDFKEYSPFMVEYDRQ